MHDGEPPRPGAGQDAGAQDGGAQVGGAQGGGDGAALARDWITVWQSELSGAAVDREVQETWQKLAASWAEAAQAMLRAWPRPDPDGLPPAAGGPARARPAATARPAPAAAAPDPRDAEIDRLAGRVAELERRLARLERGA